MKNDALSSILERIEPYDVNIYSKPIFLRELNSRPDLQILLEKKLEEDEEWTKRAKDSTVCFILNDNRWKRLNIEHTSNIRLSFVGPKGIPTISLDLN